MLPLQALLLLMSPWLQLPPVSASAMAATGGDLLTLLLAEAQAPATRDFMLTCRWGCFQPMRVGHPHMHAGDRQGDKAAADSLRQAMHEVRVGMGPQNIGLSGVRCAGV